MGAPVAPPAGTVPPQRAIAPLQTALLHPQRRMSLPETPGASPTAVTSPATPTSAASRQLSLCCLGHFWLVIRLEPAILTTEIGRKASEPRYSSTHNNYKTHNPHHRPDLRHAGEHPPPCPRPIHRLRPWHPRRHIKLRQGYQRCRRHRRLQLQQRRSPARFQLQRGLHD